MKISDNLLTVIILLFVFIVGFGSGLALVIYQELELIDPTCKTLK